MDKNQITYSVFKFIVIIIFFLNLLRLLYENEWNMNMLFKNVYVYAHIYFGMFQF